MNGLIQRVATALGYARRDALATDPYLARHMTGRHGAIMGAGHPESVAVTFACIQLIAETIASLPLTLTHRDTREPATDEPLYRVLHDQANDVQTALEFREQWVASCLLTGNGYARKTLDSRGRVIALEPLAPERVRPERRADGRVRYVYEPEPGKPQVLLQDEVMHLRHRSADGFTGRSPIEVCRATFGLADEQLKYARTHLQASGKPSGAFVMPPDSTLSDAAYERFSREIKQSFADDSPPLLEGGVTFQSMALSLRDSQFIESAKLTGLDVCRVFRVPPPSVGILDNATYSNITEQSAMLVKHCLRPWMVRIEQCLRASLLTPAGRARYRIEHNAEGLLRGSLTERYEAYRIAREWGWLNVNEIRERESLIGIGDAGDEYRAPLNSEAVTGQSGGDTA